MGYRETFFNNTPSMMGKYQCVRCGCWFKKADIDVDHRIPKKHGGTDDIWNLQAMCKHCNRSKGKNVTSGEIASTLINSAATGNLGNAVGSIAKQQLKNGVDNQLQKTLGKKAGKAVSSLLGTNYKR